MKYKDCKADLAAYYTVSVTLRSAVLTQGEF